MAFVPVQGARVARWGDGCDEGEDLSVGVREFPAEREGCGPHRRWW